MSDRTKPVEPPDDRGLIEEELELAALLALDALPGEERAALELRFRARPELWAEVRSLREAADELALEDAQARPRADLWPRIRERVARMRAARSAPPGASPQLWRRWPGESATERVLRAEESAFEPTSIEGIAVRRLFVDEANDRITMLVRMQPGTAYPPHRHGGPEECFVLEGEIEVGGSVRLRAGDYQRMDEGSVHATQSTEEGCLLLITSSRRDELLG